MASGKPTFIDLFAGAGGLSLGLEQAGFMPVFVSELNPDALETYLMNRDGFGSVDLRDSDNHVGDISTISRDDDALMLLAKNQRKKHGDISLVVGGPPCQGYSGIGHRRSFDVSKLENPSNHLYLDMARVIEVVQPKMFVFENVRGLLSSRWNVESGDKGEIWREVLASFSSIGEKGARGYKILWQLVHAKDYGVAQNRPRVLMIGVRDDISVPMNLTNIAGGLLPEPEMNAPDLIDLLGDLVDPDFKAGISRVLDQYPFDASTPAQRHLRQGKHGRGRSRGSAGQIVTEMHYSKHSHAVSEKFKYMLANQGEIHPEHRTKKFAQRLLPSRWPDGIPTITATSLPDDYVHFSQPRTPTVREWARLQTFPDWYEFAGKRTTGGLRRAGNPLTGNWDREAPKYTQIGNAVPVELGRRVGKHLLSLLNS
jgi:DNA (cytosine-5)-methyltransferase 1